MLKASPEARERLDEIAQLFFTISEQEKEEMMCSFCMEHGHDDKWYMNFENYLFHKIYRTPEEVAEVKSRYFKALRDTDRYGDPGYNHDAEYLRKKYKTTPGQIITTEEAMKVMQLGEEACKREDTIMAISKCNCALTYHGTLDYRCIVFGVPVSWGMEIGYAKFPEAGLTEFGGADWRELRSNLKRAGKSTLDAAEATELMKNWAKKGVHHTLVSRGVLPLIDGICNCEAPYCMRIRHRQLTGVVENCLVKGHYVARVNPEKCAHCGLCKIQCEFGAITSSRHSHYTSIDPFLCFGCGICRMACKKEAIEMVPREKIPAVANLW